MTFGLKNKRRTAKLSMVTTLTLLQIVYSGGLPFGIFIISHFLTVISPSLPPLSIALAYPLEK
jgi:hypothetical protein